MNLHFILDENHNPVPATLSVWSKWFSNIENRRVGKDRLPNGAEVSTVCLGSDHGQDEDGRPLLFETMVWDTNDVEHACIRYATWAEAEIGHRAAVEEASKL